MSKKNKGFNGSNKDQKKQRFQLVQSEATSEENVVHLSKMTTMLDLEITPEKALSMDFPELLQIFADFTLELKQRYEDEGLLEDEDDDLFHYESLLEKLITTGKYLIEPITEETSKREKKMQLTIAVTTVIFLLTQASGTMSFDARQESKDYRDRISEF